VVNLSAVGLQQLMSQQQNYTFKFAFSEGVLAGKERII
jgi:hypothetical protein